jgi:two-component system, NarL family, nitrate/nitrite response regulator NarL
VSGPWRILIVDDHEIFVRGVSKMFEDLPWVQGAPITATDCRGALEKAPLADIVVMDVGLPDGDGVDATRRILRDHPGTRVLVLSMYADEDVVRRAMRAGALGYVAKSSPPERLIEGTHAVAQGNVYLDQVVSPHILSLLHGRTSPWRPPLDLLTARERYLLGLLLAGTETRVIARRLDIAEKTVRNQLSTVYAKLGTTNKTAAVLLAREKGLDASPEGLKLLEGFWRRGG